MHRYPVLSDAGAYRPAKPCCHSKPWKVNLFQKIDVLLLDMDKEHNTPLRYNINNVQISINERKSQ